MQGMDGALEQLWSTISRSASAHPDLAGAHDIVPAANNLMNLATTHGWAIRNHLPSSVIVLLGVCMVISGALVGHASGESGYRHVGPWMALNVLVMLVVFVILDFDRPRRGLINVDQSPLIEARERMQQ
jgi:hypothetical protein